MQADLIVLPNLILAEKAIPEFIDGDGTPERLAGAVIPLLADSPERSASQRAFRRLESPDAVARPPSSRR